jgi:large subunit ribosomal protein L24
VLRDKGRVVVEGVSFLKRHTPNPQRQIKGGIVEREAPIHVSNVMIVCGACGKATRIGHNVLADGKKVRICRSCNSSLDK